MESIEDYQFTRVSPSDSTVEFTMHTVSASYILDLCNKLFDKNPDCYLLHIKGYKWDLKEELSEKATQNLEEAFAFLIEQLADPQGLAGRLSKVVDES